MHLFYFLFIYEQIQSTYKWVMSALRVRVLRALVFLGSLTRKTRRCAPPPAHRSFAAPFGDINVIIERTPRKKHSLGKNSRVLQLLL